MVRRLNIKLSFLTFTALWLFGQAGEILGHLQNPTLAEQIRHAKGDTTALSSEGVTVIPITDLILVSGFASLIGLLVGLVISLLICRKRKWHWINSVLPLLLVYLLGWLHTDKFSFTKQVLTKPGEMVNGIWYYIVNGFVCVTLGLLTFALVRSMNNPNDSHQLSVEPQST